MHQSVRHDEEARDGEMGKESSVTEGCPSFVSGVRAVQFDSITGERISCSKEDKNRQGYRVTSISVSLSRTACKSNRQPLAPLPAVAAARHSQLSMQGKGQQQLIFLLPAVPKD